MTFNGAAPTRVLSTSPGKYAGQDNGWVFCACGYVNYLKMHNPTNAAPDFAGRSHLGDYSDSLMEAGPDCPDAEGPVSDAGSRGLSARLESPTSGTGALACRRMLPSDHLSRYRTDLPPGSSRIVYPETTRLSFIVWKRATAQTCLLSSPACATGAGSSGRRVYACRQLLRGRAGWILVASTSDRARRDQPRCRADRHLGHPRGPPLKPTGWTLSGSFAWWPQSFAGDPGAGRPVVVPSVEEEDATRPHREREFLVQERVRIENRIAALLATQGVQGEGRLSVPGTPT